MRTNTDELCAKSYDGHFLDFTLKSGLPLYTDYHLLDKEIVLCKNGSELKLAEKKCRLKISSIEKLTRIFEKLVLAIVEIFHTNSICDIAGTPFVSKDKERHSLAALHMYSYHLDFTHLKIDLLVQQLIFDVLFDKYLNEAEKITLGKYSKQISSMLYTDKPQRLTAEDAIYRNLKRGIEHNYLMKKLSPQLREDLVLLGVDPDKYNQYFNPKVKENPNKKKPKPVWDYFYYNRNMITYRQYRRELKKDGNYSYEQFVKDLTEYNGFVKKLLPAYNESPKKFFTMSMDYYVLESYKRIDFICKLITTIPKERIAEIDREHFWVKHFHPCVLIPYEKNNNLYFAEKCKYYRPLFLIEEALHKHQQDANKLDLSFYADQLLKHHIIRAKAYELFKYHFEYISSDYSEIKKFILQSYNMLSYHNSNKLCKFLEGNSWNNLDNTSKKQIKIFLHDFIQINKALFWDSPKRKFKAPTNKKNTS